MLAESFEDIKNKIQTTSVTFYYKRITELYVFISETPHFDILIHLSIW